MGKLFGTDGVRGIANSELTCELAFRLGQAGAYVLASNSDHKPRILVGKDTRVSGDMLESALVAGICSTGAEAIRLGIVPTPAVAYLTRAHQADAGVVISASHNPVEFNGIKFFNSEGYKLRDEIEEEIEDIIINKKRLPLPTGTELGRCHKLKTAKEEYVDFALSTVWCRFDGLKVALDCANGASYVTSPDAISRLGAEVVVIHNKPDGSNINKNCGSTHLDDLQRTVVENGCDLGLAFDGDADRMLAVDHEGNVVDGDVIMAICALELKKKGVLANDTLVATVMSNMGLSIMAEQYGIHLEKTKVGDRYVLENMRQGGHIIGGEQSGHIIFLQHNTTGDGLVSALQLLQVVKTNNTTLKELSKVITILPQALSNAKVKNECKNSYMEDEVIAEAIRRLEEEFSGEGRVLIRPSGTEPLIRVMIEGKDQEEITAKAKELAALMEVRLA